MHGCVLQHAAALVQRERGTCPHVPNSGHTCSPAHTPCCPTRRGRKRWILSVPVRGEIWLDNGAQAAVQVGVARCWLGTVGSGQTEEASASRKACLSLVLLCSRGATPPPHRLGSLPPRCLLPSAWAHHNRPLPTCATGWANHNRPTANACRSHQDRKKSLFSAGIIKVEGEFEAQVRPWRVWLEDGPTPTCSSPATPQALTSCRCTLCAPIAQSCSQLRPGLHLRLPLPSGRGAAVRRARQRVCARPHQLLLARGGESQGVCLFSF